MEKNLSENISHVPLGQIGSNKSIILGFYRLWQQQLVQNPLFFLLQNLIYLKLKFEKKIFEWGKKVKLLKFWFYRKLIDSNEKKMTEEVFEITHTLETVVNKNFFLMIVIWVYFMFWSIENEKNQCNSFQFV